MKRALLVLVTAGLFGVLAACGEDDGSTDGGSSYCCKTCNPETSKPCGDTCISKSYTCHVSGGCAC